MSLGEMLLWHFLLGGARAKRPGWSLTWRIGRTFPEHPTNDFSRHPRQVTCSLLVGCLLIIGGISGWFGVSDLRFRGQNGPASSQSKSLTTEVCYHSKRTCRNGQLSVRLLFRMCRFRIGCTKKPLNDRLALGQTAGRTLPRTFSFSHSVPWPACLPTCPTSVSAAAS